MRSVSISVTEASRNFADCVNRVRYQGTAFLLHKGGVPVARIIPLEHNAKNGNELDTRDTGPESAQKQPDSPVNAEPGTHVPSSFQTHEIW